MRFTMRNVACGDGHEILNRKEAIRIVIVKKRKWNAFHNTESTDEINLTRKMKRRCSKYMWEGSSMSLAQSLVVSLLGLTVVFCALVILALALIVFSKIFAAVGAGGAKAAAVPAAVVKEESLDEESYAVIMAAVCEEMHETPDKFKIVSIKEM